VKCGTCTMCCLLLGIKSVDSPPGKWCRHAEPGEGCTIYEARPDECSSFRCAWMQMETVSDNLRPDLCKAIFEKIGNDIFFCTQHPAYGIKRVVKRQIGEFVKQGFSVVAKTAGNNHPAVIPAKGKTAKEVWQKFEAERKKINGDTLLHN